MPATPESADIDTSGSAPQTVVAVKTLSQESAIVMPVFLVMLLGSV